ncbi:MAG TPA: tripartite tricarboxylate transporter substrate binding protein [Burkholderiales bacterium]|nr:tripartite tricarboxylate transporter substrate binding protein [Burkholderiales bacterium]
MRIRFVVAMLLAWDAGCAYCASPDSEAYPARPVRFLVPLPPGGSPDVMARTIANGLAGVWPQTIVVDNRPGANHNLAAELVARSAPDGYTWLLTTDNILTVNPHLGKTPFDPFKDFTPVTQLARLQFLLVVHPSVPAKSVAELVALAKAKPGMLNYGSSGNGSPQHLGAALLQYLAGIQMHHVPYKGAAPAIVDLLPGRIQVWVGAANSLLPHIRDGKLRLLASAGSQRYPILPEAPTVAEAGLPGYALDVWMGLTMPAKVPGPIVSRVNSDVATVVNAPDVRSRLAAQGIDVTTGSPQALGQLAREDYARWGKIIKAAGIKAD